MARLKASIEIEFKFDTVTFLTLFPLSISLASFLIPSSTNEVTKKTEWNLFNVCRCLKWGIKEKQKIKWDGEREKEIIIKYNLKHFQFHWIFNQKINITLPKKHATTKRRILSGGEDVVRKCYTESTIAVNYYADNLPRHITESQQTLNEKKVKELKSWHDATWKVSEIRGGEVSEIVKGRRTRDGKEQKYLLKMPFILRQWAHKYFRCFRIFEQIQKEFFLLISSFALWLDVAWCCM